MATLATEISPHKKTNPRGAMVLLSSAICEWILMVLLFVDATFSHILRRFAEYCGLPIPCLFCSRIGTPSGKSKFGWYNSLLCRSHREEISSLVSCHIHGNVVDLREMCEECFMLKQDRLNSGTYMVCKSGLEIEQHRIQSLLLHRQALLASSGPRICQCCHKSWGAKPYSQRVLDLTSVGFGASKANVKPPLPRVPGRSRFSRRNSFRKPRDRLSAPTTPLSGDKSPSDAMSHGSYIEMNYTSDSEIEVHTLDGNKGAFAFRGRNYMNQEHYRHYVARTLLKSLTADAVLEKQSNHISADVTSLLDQHMQQLETHKFLPTHGLEELNWEQLHPRSNNTISPEITIFYDASEGPSNESEDASINMEPRPHIPSITIPAELISLKNTPSGREDKNSETSKSHDEDGLTLAQQPSNATSFSFGGVPYISNDISSANLSAKTGEGMEVSTTSVELAFASGSTNFEEIKAVLHQSAPKQEDCQKVTASSSEVNHVQDLASPERNESGLKFPERVSLSDVEGESTIDMLKSQIEYDRKCMDDLYKELEEERNAASIAANQAMTMITRLQEEKAALRMNALQYLRMMDEQAEYDMEALQKANDQIAEMEKEFQDLEYELEFYRDIINGGIPVLDQHKESISTTGKNTNDNSWACHNGSSHSEPTSPVSSGMGIADDILGNAESSISNLDEEKLYLVEYLKQLERRVHEAYCTKPSTGLNNRELIELNPNKIDYQENINACCEETNHDRSNLQNNSTSGREPNMAILEYEIAKFKEMLKAFEADREFIKHSLIALHYGNNGLEYVQHIIDQLQQLRNREFKKRCLSLDEESA